MIIIKGEYVEFEEKQLFYYSISLPLKNGHKNGIFSLLFII